MAIRAMTRRVRDWCFHVLGSLLALACDTWIAFKEFIEDLGRGPEK